MAFAALPFAGWPLPAAWLTVMTLVVAFEHWAVASPNRKAHGVEQISQACSWILSVGYSVAALFFVLYYSGSAQTFGVTLYGVIMFQILAKDYTNPRRLLFNLIPPVLSVVLVQSAAAASLIVNRQALQIVTLISSPFLVFWVFRSVQHDLAENRRRLSEASARAEASARQIHDAHRIMLMAEDLAGVGHWRLDMSTRTLDGSAGARRICGFDPSAAMPGLEDLLAMCGPEYRGQIVSLAAATARNGTPFSFETRINRADGQCRHVIANGAADRDAAGQVATIFGTIMDVTHARVREEALRESESRFRTLADHSTDVVVWCRPDGGILYASPSSKSLGYSPNQLAGRMMQDLIHPDDLGRCLSNMAGRFAGEPVDASERREFRFLTGDGRYVWLDGRPSIIWDLQGQPGSVVTSFRDVTLRRQLEDDLVEAKLRAEAAAEAKAEFLANMSHEIRTPLTGVIGFANLLNEMHDLPAVARTHVQRIVTSGHALLSVVNDILDFSKLEARQVELDPRPFEVRGFLEDTVAMFNGQAAAKQLEIALEVDARTPEILNADSARLRQILVNLINNALKFTERGGVRVSAAYDAAQAQFRVTVADTGSGIPADKLERLFQRFSQVDGSISRRHGGSGLGLAIGKNLSELMGGGIAVTSTVDVGSTFQFWVQATPAGAAALKIADAVARPDPKTRPSAILVVDDLDVNRELVRAILEAMGHAVEEAPSGTKAVEAATQRPFDLILMDLQMPGMDGFAAAGAIRARAAANRRTPIVALSANVLPEHVEASVAAGMNDHIGKPIALAELLDVVARWSGVQVDEDAAAKVDRPA